MPGDAMIRKYRNHMEISGAAVIVFGLWGFIRIFLYISLGPEKFADIIQDLDVEVPVIAVKIFFYFVCALISAADIGVRFFIGKNAIKTARGKQVKPTYVYIAIIYLAVAISLDISSILNVEGNDVFTTVTSLIVSFTSCFALLDVIVSSIKLYTGRKAYMHEATK